MIKKVGDIRPNSSGAMKPSASSMSTAWTQPEFVIGGTRCFNTNIEAGRQAVFKMWSESHPHIIRVIGSLPGSDVVERVRKCFLRNLLFQDIGPILIGGNETHNHSGDKLQSIPGLARMLQRMSWQSSMYGNMLDVFGTNPILPTAQLGADRLDILGNAERDLVVNMQRGLRKSLVFPTEKINAWDTEQNSVMNLIGSWLERNQQAQYSVIVVGGGQYTKRETDRVINELIPVYGDRVRILPVEHSGQTANLLCKSNIRGVNPIDLSSASLGKELRKANQQIDIGAVANPTILRDWSRFVAAFSENAIFQTSNYKFTDQLIYELVKLQDLARSNIVDGNYGSKQFNRLFNRFIQSTGMAQSRSEISAALSLAMQNCAWAALETKSKHASGPSSVEGVTSNTTRIRTTQPGQIYSLDGVTRAVINNGNGVSILINDQGQTVPLYLLLGNTTNPHGNLQVRPLSAYDHSKTPQAIPGWNSLEKQGGILQYKDHNGQVIGTEEILEVNQAADEYGQQLPLATHRQLTLIRRTLGQEPQLMQEVRHVNSLIFPDTQLWTMARSVAVYPFVDSLAKTPAYPAADKTVIPFKFRNLNSAVSELFDDCKEVLRANQAAHFCKYTQNLAGNINAETIECLKGKDPQYQALLDDLKIMTRELGDTKQFISRFVDTLCVVDPEAASNLRRVISAKSGISVRLDSIRKFLEKYSEDETKLRSLREQATVSIIKIASLQELVELQASRQVSEFLLERFTGEAVTDDIISECANLALQASSIVNKYTPEKIKDLLKQGYFLGTLSKQETNTIVAFDLYRLPNVDSPDRAQYRLVVCDPVIAPDYASLVLMRAATVDFILNDVNKVEAFVNSENRASQSSTLMKGFDPTAGDIEVRQGLGLQTYMGHPGQPGIFQTSEKRDQRRLFEGLREVVDLGFINPTAEEQNQMLGFSALHKNQPFVFLSFGAASMTEETKAELIYLLKNELNFRNEVVLSFAATQEANQSNGFWQLESRGTHAVVAKLGVECAKLGIAVTDTQDPGYAKVITVQASEGTFKTYNVALTETNDGSKCTVVLNEGFPVISSPVTRPENYTGDLGIFHIEQIRAGQLAEHFDSSYMIYAGGGGINAWSIKHYTEKLNSEYSNHKVVLLKGFGGTTDKLASDPEWLNEHADLIQRGRLIIIDKDTSRLTHAGLADIFKIGTDT